MEVLNIHGKNVVTLCNGEALKAITNSIIANGGKTDAKELKKNAKHFGNVVAPMLIELKSMDDYHFDPFHACNGIVVTQVDNLFTQVRALDDERSFDYEAFLEKENDKMLIKSEVNELEKELNANNKKVQIISKPANILCQNHDFHYS